MNFFRSIDTYLLERFPILWHSKLVYLLFAGIVFALLFFGAGHVLTDLDAMKQVYNLGDYYGDSYAVLFHVILTLIVLCFWALAFFKKNAVRHFYPLKRLYFTRLYLCIALGFFAVFSAPLSFQAGVRMKIRSTVSLEELQKDARTSNLALAFLPREGAQYPLSERVYPKPFPLTILYNDAPENLDWKLDLNYKYVSSNGDTLFYYPNEHPEYTVRPTGYGAYQLFHVKEVNRYVNCSNLSVYYVQDFYIPDSTERILENDVLNYATIRFPGSFEPIANYKAGSSFYDYYYEPDYESQAYIMDTLEYIEFTQHYAPKIHRWVLNDRKDSIRAAVKGFREVLEKYDIPVSLDERIVAHVLSEEEYYDIPVFINDNMNNYDGSIRSSEYFLKKIQRDPVKFRTAMKTGTHFMGFEFSELERLYQNAQYGYAKGNSHYPMDSETILLTVITVLSLAFAFLFLLFDFTNFIQFLIAIPAAGVLMILTGLGVVLIELTVRGDYQARETYTVMLFFTVECLVLMLSIFSVFSRAFGKRFAGVLLNIGYMAAPFFPVMLIILLAQLTQTYHYDGCDYINYEYRSVFWEIADTPWIMIPLSTLSAICYFALIKRWYAKEE
jgi:hypothetical protein